MHKSVVRVATGVDYIQPKIVCNNSSKKEVSIIFVYCAFPDP